MIAVDAHPFATALALGVIAGGIGVGAALVLFGRRPRRWFGQLAAGVLLLLGFGVGCCFAAVPYGEPFGHSQGMEAAVFAVLVVLLVPVAITGLWLSSLRPEAGGEGARHLGWFLLCVTLVGALVAVQLLLGR